MAEELTAGLWYAVRGNRMIVSASGAREPLVDLVAAGGRATVGLLLIDGTRRIDVSVQPAAAAGVLEARARRERRDPNGWTGALARALVVDLARCGVDGPAAAQSQGLVGVLGAAAFPMLAASYGAGVGAAGEVPRWAAPALTASTVPAFAGALFGARATRPVVRACARWLTARTPGADDRGLGWWPLGLAWAARGFLEPDLIAAVVDMVSSAPAPAPGPPSGEDLAAVRRGAAVAGAERTVRLVGDALAQEDGCRRLVRALRLLVSADDDLRRPAPTTLRALEDECLSVVAVDPAPSRAVVAAAPARPAPPAPAPPTQPAWTRPRGAPPAPAGTRDGAEPFAYPLHIRRLDGAEVGSVRLVLPRTPVELVMWGRVLHNCLADFGPAVAAGRSLIVGVRHHERLAAALELRPEEGSLVQFLGVRNNRPPVAITAAVIDHLRREGLLAGASAAGAR